MFVLYILLPSIPKQWCAWDKVRPRKLWQSFSIYNFYFHDFRCCVVRFHNCCQCYVTPKSTLNDHTKSALLLIKVTANSFKFLFTSKYYHSIISIYLVGKFINFFTSIRSFSSNAYLALKYLPWEKCRAMIRTSSQSS